MAVRRLSLNVVVRCRRNGAWDAIAYRADALPGQPCSEHRLLRLMLRLLQLLF